MKKKRRERRGGNEGGKEDGKEEGTQSPLAGTGPQPCLGRLPLITVSDNALDPQQPDCRPLCQHHSKLISGQACGSGSSPCLVLNQHNVLHFPCRGKGRDTTMSLDGLSGLEAELDDIHGEYRSPLSTGDREYR